MILNLSGFAKMNFNDFYNSMTCLWVLTLQNGSTTWFSMLDMMDETTEHLNKHRTWKQVYFLAFYFLIKVVLLNVFIGQVISVSLTYLTESKDEEERDKFERAGSSEAEHRKNLLIRGEESFDSFTMKEETREVVNLRGSKQLNMAR